MEMEVFEYHTRIHCEKCKSVQDQHTNMIKKANGNFRILVTCLTCNEMLMSEFSAMQLVSKMSNDLFFKDSEKFQYYKNFTLI